MCLRHLQLQQSLLSEAEWPCFWVENACDRKQQITLQTSYRRAQTGSSYSSCTLSLTSSSLQMICPQDPNCVRTCFRQLLVALPRRLAVSFISMSPKSSDMVTF